MIKFEEYPLYTNISSSNVIYMLMKLAHCILLCLTLLKPKKKIIKFKKKIKRNDNPFRNMNNTMNL